MHADRIRELAPLLPDSAPYFNTIVPSNGRWLSDIDKIAYCENDLRFRWLFTKTFLDLRLPLPRAVHEIEMIRAYELMCGRHDDEMREVFILAHPGNSAKSNIIDAHLLHAGHGLAEIARVLNLEPDILSMYSSMFFDIRPKLENKVWIMQYLHPETRLHEMTSFHYLQVESPRMVLLRTCYHSGIDAARKLVGLEPFMSNQNSIQALKEFEALTHSTSAFLTSVGGANARMPVISMSGRLAAATKISGQDTSTEDVSGFGAISRKISVLDVILADQKPDIDIMLSRLKSANPKEPARDDS